MPAARWRPPMTWQISPALRATTGRDWAAALLCDVVVLSFTCILARKAKAGMANVMCRPAVPRADLRVGQPDFLLGHLEAHLDGPAPAGDAWSVRPHPRRLLHCSITVDAALKTCQFSR